MILFSLFKSGEKILDRVKDMDIPMKTAFKGITDNENKMFSGKNNSLGNIKVKTFDNENQEIIEE